MDKRIHYVCMIKYGASESSSWEVPAVLLNLELSAIALLKVYIPC